MLSCTELRVRNSTSLVWVSLVLQDAATHVRPRSRLRGDPYSSLHPADVGRRWTSSLISFCGSCIIFTIQRVPILGVRQVQQMSGMGGAIGNYTKVAHVYSCILSMCLTAITYGSSPTREKIVLRCSCCFRVGNNNTRVRNSGTYHNRSRTRIQLFTYSLSPSTAHHAIVSKTGRGSNWGDCGSQKITSHAGSIVGSAHMCYWIRL